MVFSLQHIGKIAQAKIELPGITVLAGDNDTGKSTVGKALHAFINAFHNAEEKISAERRQTLCAAIRDAFRHSGVRTVPFGRARRVFDESIEEVLAAPRQREAMEELIFRMQGALTGSDKRELSREDMEGLLDRLGEILTVEDADLLRGILDRYFHEEFENQINKLGGEKRGEIRLEIKGKTLWTAFMGNHCVDFGADAAVTTNAIYLDSPFVLDEMGDGNFGFRGISHRDYLLSLLEGESRRPLEGIIDEELGRRRLRRVMEKIGEVVPGYFVSGEEVGLKMDSLPEPLALSNLSTGMKTFAILKRLLENGQIREKGVLILDEPEIHLHPQWQMVFAELLVLMQKELSLHILLNTHSPYFLNAVEVYAARHHTGDRCRYYLARCRENGAEFTDVTGNTEAIYEKLARPLQILENIRYGMDKDA